MMKIFGKYYSKLQSFLFYTKNTYFLLSGIEIDKLKADASIPLNTFEHKIYSQHGEDGIITEIFKRIGVQSKTFFEFGAGAGTENNTIALLLDGWKGWWVDGGDYIDTYKTLFAESIQEGFLTVSKNMISSKNINSIVKDLDMPKEIDLLSIDIDGNDYYVWKALEATKPRVVVVEYNAAYPVGHMFLQKESEKMWNGSNFFGASLSRFNALAQEKGYTLVCCDITGTNAFFVRNDLVGDRFEYAGDVTKLWYKPRYYLYYFGGHAPTLFQGNVPAMGEWVREGK